MTRRHTDTSVSRGPATTGEIPALADPGVQPAPLGQRRVGNRFVEVLVGDVARQDQRRPGQCFGQRLEVPLRSCDQGNRGSTSGERVGEQAARVHRWPR